MKRQNTNKALAGLALAMLAVLLLVVLAGAVQGTEAGKAASVPEDWTEHQVTAHRVAEQLRAQGYKDDNPVIRACQEWWRAEDAKEDAAWAAITQGTQTEYVTKAQRMEYPEAAAVWQLLREAGIDEIHAAAILGNAMAESGGHSLNLNLYQRVDGYYGIWAMSLRYFPEVDGQGAPGQVAVLLDTLESNITAGGGDVSYWWSITDVREAAKYFSDFWERPAFWSSKRADNAELALEYFGP